MRVDLTIRHIDTAAADVRAALEGKFGSSDPDVLGRSPLFAPRAASWGNHVLFCGETPEARVICWSIKNDELQAVVEPVSGRLEYIFQSVWEGLEKALRHRRAELAHAAQIDDVTGQTIQEGSVGLTAEIRRKDVYLPLFLASISVVWIGLGLMFWVNTDRLKFFSGSITTLAGGVAALVLLWANTKRKRIRWQGQR